MSSKKDLELVEEFQRGKIEGFNEIVRRYQEKIYWFCRRIVGTHEDADDVVQDVFVRVYESIARFRGDSEFYTWVYRIATNASLNALRKKRVKEFIRYDEIFEELLPSETRTDDAVHQQEYQTILER